MSDNALETIDVILPSDKSLKHASRIAITQDRPIMLDYWSSTGKNCIVGIRENGEKLLIKNKEEYTSPITKIFSVGTELLVLTENSLYIVSSKVDTKKIDIQKSE